ncbi:MAG: hypothetical protein ACR2GR_06520 [Rhodothermales bacterium]
MSIAKLNVWVTKVGNPCDIDDTRQWYIHVLHCDGRIVRWCDRDYRNIKTECGHAEIEIPPGCYQVVATWSPASGTGELPTTLGNHITHLQVVRVNCGDHACVTLFPPTFHFCGVWWIVAAQQHAELGRLPADEAKAAIEAVQRLMEHDEADPFTQRMLKEINEQRPEQGRESQQP